VANVKSSAISPRHPEVPNLMGDAAVFAEALMAGYSTRSAIVLKDESASKEDGAEQVQEEREYNAETQSTLRFAEKRKI